MKPKQIKSFIKKSLIAMVAITLIVFGFFKSQIFGEFELSNYYGINSFYVFYRYKTANLLITIIVLYFLILFLLGGVTYFLENEEHKSKFWRFLTSVGLFLLVSGIIGCFHGINYYGFNANYKIDEDLKKFQFNRDSIRFSKAINKNDFNISGVIEIENLIQKIENDKIPTSSSLNLGGATRHNGYQRINFETGVDRLEIYFRTFDINRSIRFKYEDSSKKEHMFLFTLPYKLIPPTEINEEKYDLIKKVNKFYDDLPKLVKSDKKGRINKFHLLEVLNLIKADFVIVKSNFSKKRGELRKTGISWDLFIYDTIFSSIGRNQKYFKGFDFFSRSLLLLHGLVGLFFIRLALPIVMKK